MFLDEDGKPKDFKDAVKSMNIELSVTSNGKDDYTLSIQANKWLG